MMTFKRFFRWFGWGAFVSIVLASGCATQTGTGTKSAIYRVISESRQAVTWEGQVPEDSGLDSGAVKNSVEVTFKQDVLNTDDKGNKTSRITITGLKCFSEAKNTVITDFDSSREQDKLYPLNQIIGQGYTIKTDPKGKVIKITDIDQARSVAKDHVQSMELLSDKAIENRHSTLKLSGKTAKNLKAGETWNDFTSFSFGKMGWKAFEKVYIVKESQDRSDCVEVVMEGIPSSKLTEQLHKQYQTQDFSQRFGNNTTYKGQLILSLKTGDVQKYSEKLESEWITGDLPTKKDATAGPVSLTMSAVRSYSMEKLN